MAVLVGIGRRPPRHLTPSAASATPVPSGVIALSVRRRGPTPRAAARSLALKRAARPPSLPAEEPRASLLREPRVGLSLPLGAARTRGKCPFGAQRAPLALLKPTLGARGGAKAGP